MGAPVHPMPQKEHRPKPKSGVDDVDHIYERIQELRREKQQAELDKEPFLKDQETITFRDAFEPEVVYTATRYTRLPLAPPDLVMNEPTPEEKAMWQRWFWGRL